MVAAQRTTVGALRGGTPQDQEADAEGLAEGAEWLGRESAEEEDAAWEGEDTLGDQMQVLKATSAARRSSSQLDSRSSSRCCTTAEGGWRRMSGGTAR